MLDHEKDYVVRRLRIGSKGHIGSQTDIEYRTHDVAGWVPSSWVFNKYSAAGNTLKTTRVEVVEFRVNDAQQADLFDIQFPPGTGVLDNKNNGKLYIVKSDGSMRGLSLSGEELPGSVFQPGTPWYRRHQWLLVSVLALAVVAAGVVWAKRKKRNAQGAGP